MNILSMYDKGRIIKQQANIRAFVLKELESTNVAMIPSWQQCIPEFDGIQEHYAQTSYPYNSIIVTSEQPLTSRLKLLIESSKDLADLGVQNFSFRYSTDNINIYANNIFILSLIRCNINNIIMINKKLELMPQLILFLSNYLCPDSHTTDMKLLDKDAVSIADMFANYAGSRPKPYKHTKPDKVFSGSDLYTSGGWGLLPRYDITPDGIIYTYISTNTPYQVKSTLENNPRVHNTTSLNLNLFNAQLGTLVRVHKANGNKVDLSANIICPTHQMIIMLHNDRPHPIYDLFFGLIINMLVSANNIEVANAQWAKYKKTVHHTLLDFVEANKNDMKIIGPINPARHAYRRRNVMTVTANTKEVYPQPDNKSIEFERLLEDELELGILFKENTIEGGYDKRQINYGNPIPI